MNLSQLNALVAIAEQGSFSGAADALATVQSNVSTHVKKLERELGTILVDRTNGQLTPAGELVTARARRARAEIDAAMSDVLALQHDVAGTVRIGIIGTTARWLVPNLLDVVPGRYPRLRLVFVESTTTALESQVMVGHVDLAILNLPHASSELLLTPLFEEELVLVTSLDHRLADAGEISVRELDGMPILVPQRGTAFRDDLDEAVGPLGVTLCAAGRGRRHAPHRIAHLRGLWPSHTSRHSPSPLSPGPVGDGTHPRDTAPGRRSGPACPQRPVRPDPSRPRSADRDRSRPRAHSRRPPPGVA